jgi:O-acetyl-ADP-ribose deacetylase (regulator of RNase III)
MTPIEYVAGDATRPAGNGPMIVAHVCNDAGGWGRGFVVAVSDRWPEPERAYRSWYRGRAGNDFRLGAVQVVAVGPDLWVANMIGQHGIRSSGGVPPIRYDALRQCLAKVADEAVAKHATVHVPRIGAGLAGGRWDQVEELLVDELAQRDVAVTVYDLPGTSR